MIAVLGSPTKGNRVLVDGLRGLGLPVELIAPTVARQVLKEDDVAVNRLDVRSSLDGVEPGLLEVLWLERSRTRVVNSVRALLNAHDKLRCHAVLARVGLAQVQALHITTVDELRTLDPPVVVKPRFGSWGRDVARCRDQKELDACALTVATRPWFRRHGAIVQPLLPSSGRDLRILVGGGTVIGAATRVAASGEWRTNVSLGGTLEPAEPSQQARDLAIAAARAIGADFVGIDLFPLEDREWVVLELNGAAEFDVRYSFPGRNLFADIARALALG